MTGTNSIIEASRDTDLRDRFVAAAILAGKKNPETWVAMRLNALLMSEVGEGQKVVDVHAYAVASYSPPPRPGADDTKITDAHLAAAIAAVDAQETQTPDPAEPDLAEPDAMPMEATE